MIQMTPGEMAFAYAEARRSQIPIVEMGRVERAGYYLMLSAGATKDGALDFRGAIERALMANEIDVAVELADRFMPEVEVEPDPRYRMRGNGNFGASGEIAPQEVQAA